MKSEDGLLERLCFTSGPGSQGGSHAVCRELHRLGRMACVAHSNC